MALAMLETSIITILSANTKHIDAHLLFHGKAIGVLEEQDSSVPMLWDSSKMIHIHLSELLQSYIEGQNCEDFLFPLPDCEIDVMSTSAAGLLQSMRSSLQGLAPNTINSAAATGVQIPYWSFGFYPLAVFAGKKEPCHRSSCSILSGRCHINFEQSSHQRHNGTGHGLVLRSRYLVSATKKLESGTSPSLDPSLKNL